MEKAYAKLVHSYYATAKGETSDALNYLTGGLVSKVATENPEEAWRALNSTITAGAFASSVCKDAIPSDKLQAVGLLHGHAYSLLCTFEQKTTGLRLVQVKNPWGSYEWSGDFSDDSPTWTESLRQEVDRVAKKQAGAVGKTLGRSTSVTAVKNDGSFWMNWDDFVTYFEDVSMCNPWLKGNARYSISSSWEPGVSAGGPVGFARTFEYNPSFAMEITGTDERGEQKSKAFVSATLSQDDVRGDDSREHFDLLCKHCDTQGGIREGRGKKQGWSQTRQQVVPLHLHFCDFTS